jgi:8-oxo-dGTP pyrophosphatase MutT (NUDIX family)
MRYEDAVARLAVLPDVLPPPPASLQPTALDPRRPRPPVPAATGRPPREAAVLVLIVPAQDGEAQIVLTERADRGGHHSGEVSFPGGRVEPDDADVVATALREAHEEVGLDAAAAEVRIVGLLEPFWIPVSDFRITPVLAIARRPPVLRPSEAEVARIVLAPIRAFLPDAEVEMVEAVIRDWPLRFGAYPVEGLRVWGATARILGQLGAVLGLADASAADVQPGAADGPTDQRD